MANEKGTRADLDIAVAKDAETNLLLAWREAQGDYTVRRVQMEDELAARFLEIVRRVSANLLERVEIPYDPEWPLKDHEYFALPNDPPVGGNLFELVSDYAN